MLGPVRGQILRSADEDFGEDAGRCGDEAGNVREEGERNEILRCLIGSTWAVTARRGRNEEAVGDWEKMEAFERRWPKLAAALMSADGTCITRVTR